MIRRRCALCHARRVIVHKHAENRHNKRSLKTPYPWIKYHPEETRVIIPVPPQLRHQTAPTTPRGTDLLYVTALSRGQALSLSKRGKIEWTSRVLPQRSRYGGNKLFISKRYIFCLYWVFWMKYYYNGKYKFYLRTW